MLAVGILLLSAAPLALLVNDAPWISKGTTATGKDELRSERNGLRSYRGYPITRSEVNVCFSREKGCCLRVERVPRTDVLHPDVHKRYLPMDFRYVPGDCH